MPLRAGIEGTQFASLRAMPGRNSTFSFTLTAAVALIGAGVLAATRRGRPANAAGAHGTPLSAARLRQLEAAPFFRLCRAYYESRRFHLHNARPRGRGCDADLYFGTLPHAVAILRVLASDGEPADVDAISDLAQVMSRRGASKGIVHTTGGYTRVAKAYARANRIRLVTVEDLAQDAARMRPAVRARLLAALEPDAEASHGQRELVPF